MSGNYWRHPVVGYCTNFGQVYCTCHGVEQPGTLGDKLIGDYPARRVPHKVERIIRGDDGWDGTPCEWPGCGNVIPPRGKATEFVNGSLQAEFSK